MAAGLSLAEGPGWVASRDTGRSLSLGFMQPAWQRTVTTGGLDEAAPRSPAALPARLGPFPLADSGPLSLSFPEGLV